jgi:Transglycosylase-like domain
VAGVRGVTSMRRIALIAASACALAVLAPAGIETASGQEVAAEQTAQRTVEPAPRKYRVAYSEWRRRLQRHRVHVGRDLLSQPRRQASAAEDAVGPTKRELRRSIHRMQRRWGHWLRNNPRGQVVAFKLRVRQKVPSWGKAHLRSIAWCESKNDPRAIGGGGAYRGMYQFSFSTWSVVGGSGDPAAASRWEQTWRAWLLLSRHGAGHWPVCG